MVGLPSSFADADRRVTDCCLQSQYMLTVARLCLRQSYLPTRPGDPRCRICSNRKQLSLSRPDRGAGPRRGAAVHSLALRVFIRERLSRHARRVSLSCVSWKIFAAALAAVESASPPCSARNCSERFTSSRFQATSTCGVDLPICRSKRVWYDSRRATSSLASSSGVAFSRCTYFPKESTFATRRNTCAVRPCSRGTISARRSLSSLAGRPSARWA